MTSRSTEGTVDVVGGVTRWPLRSPSTCRSILDAAVPPAGGATRHHESLQRRAPTDMIARRQDDLILRLYRDGGYDVWAVAPDGSNQRKLTWGPFDDREPIWSHDGTRIAFSFRSRRRARSDTTSGTLDTRSGDLRQVTKNSADDYMPSWSPDDKEIACSRRRRGRPVGVGRERGDGRRRKVSSAGGRVDAPSWGRKASRVSRHDWERSRRRRADRKARTTRSPQDDHRAAKTSSHFPASMDAEWFLLRLRRQDPPTKNAEGGSPQTIEFSRRCR